MNNSYSAGILLYKIISGTIVVLLGCDSRYKCWSDFGGKCEWIDGKDPCRTAAREFYEETSGVISSENILYDMLKKHGICVKCRSYHNNDYFMFLLSEDYVHVHKDYDIDFKNQQMILSYTKHRDMSRYKEKNNIRWISLEHVIHSPRMFRGVFSESIKQNYDMILKNAYTFKKTFPIYNHSVNN
jgi:hypothetical protein